MTDRERWTIYPLLFLSLGIATKDKFTRQVDVDRVLCKTLVVADPAGKTQVILASTARGGVVQTDGSLVVTDQQGREQVVITSTAAGGVVRAHGNQPELYVSMGQVDNLAGLVFSDTKGKVISHALAIPTSPPRPPENHPATQPDPPSNEPAAAGTPDGSQNPEPPEEKPAESQDQQPETGADRSRQP